MSSLCHEYMYVCVHVFVCVRAGWGHYVHCLVSVWRADGLSSGQRVRGGGHMGVVTSGQRYVNPLKDRDEVRLPNPRKTKVLSVRLDESSTTAAAVAWENFTRPGPRLHTAVHLWDIDDGKTPGFYTTANGL